MAKLFKGYSQKTELGGNLLKGVDPSDQILEEGKRYLSSWKDVSQGEQDNQIRYLNALDNKFQAEKEDRERNNKLESFYADGWGKALQKRHDQLIANAKAKQDEAIRNQERLGAFSQTITDLAVQAGQQHVKTQQEFGKNLAVDLGLSWELAQGIQSAQGIFNDQYKGTNDAIIEARKRGYSWDQINQINKLSWLQNQGVRIGDALNLGTNAAAHYANDSDTEYETTRGTYSINSAYATGSKEIYEAVLRKSRNKLIQNSGISDANLAKYSRPGIIKAEGRLKTALETKIRDDSQKAWDAKETQLTANAFMLGPDEVHTLITNRSGTNNEFRGNARKRTIGKEAVAAYQQGLINREHIEEFLEKKFALDGQEIKKSWDEHFPQEAEALFDAMAAADAQDNAVRQSKQNAYESQQKEDVFELKQKLLYATKPPDQAELASMIAQASRNQNTEMVTMLTAFSKNNEQAANDIIYIPELEKLEQMNMLSVSQVHSFNLSPKKHMEWLKKAIEQDPFKPNENEVKFLKDHAKGVVSSILSSYDLEIKDVESARLAIYSGEGKLQRYFADGMKANNNNRAAAMTYALETFKTDIAQDYKITKTDSSKDIFSPHFGTFTVKGKRHPYPLSDLTSKELAANPNLFNEKIVLDTVPFIKFIDDVKRGVFSGYPAEVSHIVGKFGLDAKGKVKLTELQLIEQQGKLIMGPEFELPKGLKISYAGAMGQIRPEFQRYVCGSHQNKYCNAAALKYSDLTHESGERNEEDQKLISSIGSNNKYTSIYRKNENLSRNALEIMNGMVV